MKKNLIPITILAVLGALLWGAFGTGGGEADVPAERLVKPRRGKIVRGVIAIGRVEPRTRVDLKSKANGIIQELLVDVADEVRAGEVIVELDKEILEARVAEAAGRLGQARGAVAAAEAEVRRIELEKTDPELVYAQRDRERSRKLFEDGLTSQELLDQAQDRYEAAQYRRSLLDAQLEVAKANLLSAQGRLEEVEAQEKLARQELAEATIRSPIDGVVLHRYLEEGDAVSSIRSAGGNATIIMTLGDLSELYIDGEVDEVDVGKIISEQKIRSGLVARVTVDSFKDKVFDGVVTRIAPLGLEDRNGIITFEVRIVLQNPEKLMLANMTATSQIVLEEKKDVLLLSQGALINEGGSYFAKVFDPRTGTSQDREVETGISDGRMVEIIDGLDDDQTVLIP